MSPALRDSIGPGGGEIDQETETTIRRATSGGAPLGSQVRGVMEDGFGADFSGVRVHHDSTADSLNRQFEASAFTTGNHVFFRNGAYEPTSTSGQELIAHELTHVVQQGDVAQRSPATVQRYVPGNEDLYSQPELPGGDDASKYLTLDTPDIYADIDGQDDAAKDLTYDIPDGRPEVEGGGSENALYSAPPSSGLLYSSIEALDLMRSSGVLDLGLPAPVLAKYQYTTQRGARYDDEFDNGSPDLPFIIAAGRKWAADKGKTIDEYMIKFFGWAQSDVDRYVHQGEDSAVHQMDEEERANYVLHGGSSLKQGDSDQAYDTSKMFSKHSGAGFGIFVMANDGTIYADQHKVGLFHHSTFLAGGDVACGGEIKIVGGVVRVITNKTGHYHSGDVHLVQVLAELMSRGANLNGIEVRNDPTSADAYPGGAAQFYQDNRNLVGA